MTLKVFLSHTSDSKQEVHTHYRDKWRIHIQGTSNFWHSIW